MSEKLSLASRALEASRGVARFVSRELRGLLPLIIMAVGLVLMGNPITGVPLSVVAGGTALATLLAAWVIK